MNLQARITNIITKPKEEWPVIAQEQTTVAALYQSYICLLAAIPAVATFIGHSVIGITLPFVGHYRAPMGTALVGAVVSYVLTLASVYIAAMVIEKLAPNFGSKGDTVQALKLVAFAYTPAWVAGILGIIPALGILIIIASLYCIYLFYIGLPHMMQTPADKVIPYMIVSALIIIVLSIIVGVIVGIFTAPALISPAL